MEFLMILVLIAALAIAARQFGTDSRTYDRPNWW